MSTDAGGMWQLKAVPTEMLAHIGCGIKHPDYPATNITFRGDEQTEKQLRAGTFKIVLAAGMTVVIQPNVITPDERAGVQTGALMLVTGSGWLLAGQAAVFAAGALAGLRFAPYGLLYRYLVRPRLGPPDELEDEAPPRFAQGVGLAFALVGTAGYALGGPAPSTRSVLGLGTGQRNVAAALVVATQNFADPGVVVMLLVSTFAGLVVLLVAARQFARRSEAVPIGDSNGQESSR